MKKILLIVSILAGLFLFTVPALADSPITSTGFSDAYKDIAIVKEASEQGVVNAEIAAYLSNTKNPIDVKAAVINALTWSIDGKSNAEKYSELIYKKSVSKLKVESLSGDQLFCIGYLKAMDNYMDVATSLKYLKLAEKKISNSLTVSIIRAIVEAQSQLDDTWKYIKPVVQNSNLKKDMRQDGINIILNYMAGGFQVSQNNFIIENEKSQKVCLYGTFSIQGEDQYQIVKQSDKAYTALIKDQFGICYVSITGLINGDSSIELKNNVNESMKINFSVVSSDTYKKLDKTAFMYVGSTKALVEKNKVSLDSTSVPFQKNNNQYIPISFAKAFGAKIQTDSNKGTGKITYSGKTISIKSGSNIASVNGKTIKLQAGIETKNKQLFISAKDYAVVTGKTYIYYNGLISFADTKAALNTITDDYILDEISTQISGGKSVLNYPTLYSENEKYGYKDKSGKVVIKPAYDKALDFSEGLAAVAINDEQGNLKYGYINVKGNFVVGFKYNWVGSYNNGLAPVILNDGAGFIDKSGNVIGELNYNGVGVFSSGLAPVMDKESGKCGYVDVNGKLVIPYSYDDCRLFSEGLAAVKVGEKWGYIDRTGKIVIELVYDEPGDFVNGTASAVIDNGSYTVNKSGKLLSFNEGNILICEHKNGIPNGKAVFTWADGSQYSGDVLEGQLCGYGVYTTPSGLIQEGYWENSEYKGETK
jgi:uncharacterized protein YdbL (DUF1318 family)